MRAGERAVRGTAKLFNGFGGAGAIQDDGEVDNWKMVHNFSFALLAAT
jgi:hypothetical protein